MHLRILSNRIAIDLDSLEYIKHQFPFYGGYLYYNNFYTFYHRFYLINGEGEKILCDDLDDALREIECRRDPLNISYYTGRWRLWQRSFSFIN